jgi:hypothetical protein
VTATLPPESVTERTLEFSDADTARLRRWARYPAMVTDADGAELTVNDRGGWWRITVAYGQEKATVDLAPSALRALGERLVELSERVI